MKRIRFVLLLLCVCLTAAAQLTTPARPAQRPDSKLRSAAAPVFHAIGADTVQRASEASKRRCYIGNTRTLHWNLKEMGESFVTDDGTRVWRMGIQSPGAASIGLMMEDFHLPQGAVLLLYSPDGRQLHGGYGADNNAPDHLLAIAPFPSDSLLIEYQEPPQSAFAGTVVIGEASHNFRSINHFGISEAVCAPHVGTQPQLEQVKRGVMDLYVYDNGTAWACTSWMPANQAGKPYLYTAQHCLSGQLPSSQLARRSVVYFNYEVPKQDTTIQGSIEQTLSGLSLVAAFDSLDFALMQFKQMPPRDYRAYQLGWTLSTSPGSGPTCIQHPFGDCKRVAYSLNTPHFTTLTGAEYRPCYIENGYWQINRWSKGTTESGSSGSPILTGDLQVFGGLTGGNSYCDTPVNDYFSRLDLAWDYRSEPDKQIKCWFDPEGTGIRSMEGRELYEQSCVRTTHIQPDDSLASTHLPLPENGLLAGHNTLDHDRYTERFAFDTPQTLYGMFLLPEYGRYYPSSPVYVLVYDGLEHPEHLRHRQLVYPTDLSSFHAAADTFRTVVKRQWNGTETYVRMSEVLEMDSVFFVGYEIAYDQLTPADSFAVRNTGGEPARNTAWYHAYDGWHPFSEHPLRPQATALWIDVVSLSGRPSAVRETGDTPSTTTFRPWPNPSSGPVNWEPEAQAFRLTDLQGRLLQSGACHQTHLPRRPGCYLLHLRRSNGWETHKIIRLP